MRERHGGNRVTAKEYLNQIRIADMKIEQKLKEYEDLKKRCSILNGMDYSSVRVQTSPDGQGFTRAIDKLVDLEREINADIDLFYADKHQKIGEIQSVGKPEYIDVLYRRYVEYKPLERIAADMGYSYNWCCSIHGRALKEFEKTITYHSKT